MSRYRWALAALVLVVAGVVAAVLLLHPAPADTADGAGGSGAAAAELIDPSQRSAAPELTGVQGWINSSPLTMAGLRGRVVLIDFWTFSCVNCVRTFPHLRALRDAYGSRGLVVVGVHSPEFDFERDPANVRAAVQRDGVTWPVALDPDMATWDAWSNQYWPAEYLVDREGRVAYVNFGEGQYDRTEAAVAALLGATASPSATAAAASPGLPAAGISPELYAGGEASQDHGGSGLGDGEQYGAPGTVVEYPAAAAPARQRDAIEVTGPWTDRGQYIVSGGAGHVRLRFHAGDLFVVAGSDSGDALTVQVSLDGGPVAAAMAGRALAPAGSTAAVGADDLYPLLHGVGPGDHVLDIAVPQGLRLYTFTFG